MRAYAPYTPFDEEFIRANCETMTVEDVAKSLGRTLRSVADKAARMDGVKFRKSGARHHRSKLEPGDAEMIRELKASGMKTGVIAHKFDIHTDTVRYHTKGVVA